MQNIMTMIESASVLLLSVFVVAAVRSRFRKRPFVANVLLGVMFTIVGLEVMENSIQIIPGIHTDPRAAVVTLAGAVGGPVAIAVTAPLLAFYRLHLGGLGAVPGAVYVVVTGVASAGLYHWWFAVKKRSIDSAYVWRQTLIAGIVPTLTLFFVSKAPAEVFYLTNALMAPTNFGAALLMGMLMLRDHELHDAFLDSLDKREQIDAIANNAPATLFQIQRDTSGKLKFSYMSKGACRMSQDMQHTVQNDFSTFRNAIGSDAMDHLTRQLETSEAKMEPLCVEFEVAGECGPPTSFQIDAGVRKGRYGQTVWDGTISDVTDRKQAERMKDEFISNVSHELRTPLTSIRGSIGLVVGSAGDQLPQRTKNMLDIANRNAERLVLLINDILDMQKIASGQMQFSLQHQPLRPILEQAIITAQSYDPLKKVKIVLRDDALNCESDVDANRLNQVLINLLSNAIKFSPDNATIIVSAARRGRNVRLAVQDEGPGIPDDFRSQIFQRFLQAETSSTRKAGGTGLGLNISKAITEAMGGTVGFDSVVDQGSTFYVDLPVSDMLQVAQSTTNNRVLVCSTDQHLNQTIRSTLEPDQIVTHVAPDVCSALKLLNTSSYMAMIVDLAAKHEDQSLSGLRSVVQEGDLCLIIVESDSDEVPAERLTNGSEANLLSKPVDGQRISAILNKTLSLVENDRPRVLYIEDDAAVQQVIGYSLEPDIDVVPAQSLSAAREALKNDAFDLVLLDLNLPDGSGFDILEDLPDHLPVVIFSALELEPNALGRAAAVMIKSRDREDEVAAAVLAALPRHGHSPSASA